jgi:hypothetical protein
MKKIKERLFSCKNIKDKQKKLFILLNLNPFLIFTVMVWLVDHKH